MGKRESKGEAGFMGQLFGVGKKLPCLQTLLFMQTSTQVPAVQGHALVLLLCSLAGRHKPPIARFGL